MIVKTLVCVVERYKKCKFCGIEKLDTSVQNALNYEMNCILKQGLSSVCRCLLSLYSICVHTMSEHCYSYLFYKQRKLDDKLSLALICETFIRICSKTIYSHYLGI